MTQPEPAAALDRIRRAATQWRLAHDEGDLPVAWDEAAITVLALIDNPNVTWTDLGFTRPAITGHAVVQPAPASRHTVDPLRNLVDRAEHHGGLTADEAARLRDGIQQLHAELDRLTALAVRASDRAIENGQRAERAEAALDAFQGRVQAITDEARGGIREQLGYALAALDARTRPGGQPT